MGGCCAFGCSNNTCKKLPGITYHRFPKNESRRSEWIKAVRRKNWVPTKRSVLCSSHFKEEMIDRSMNKVVLTHNAVPSIFPAFQSYLQKECQLEGFDDNREPDRIIGATNYTGELLFLIKWKDVDEADLVPSSLANEKYPELVIQFYEQRVKWTSENELEKAEDVSEENIPQV